MRKEGFVLEGDNTMFSCFPFNVGKQYNNAKKSFKILKSDSWAAF